MSVDRLSKSLDNECFCESCENYVKCENCDKMEEEYNRIIGLVNDLIDDYNKIIQEYSKRHPEEVKELELEEVQQVIKQNFSE